MGILGKKMGMTHVFSDDGERIPVTVIQTAPCVVIGKRTQERDGYTALQLGFEEKPKRLVNRPQTGFFKKNGVQPVRFIREFRVPADLAAKFEVGQPLNVTDVLEQGAPVDIIGHTKGRGYQGVMRRHGMPGTKASHGVHEFFRHGGSIGCRLTPGRVMKGKRMAGQLGNDRRTVQNLQLVQIFAEDGCIAVRGSVPGATGTFVEVKKAATRTEYKRIGTGPEEVRSKNPLKASKKAAAGR
jgi:large subunit ribosomal protein L3